MKRARLILATIAVLTLCSCMTGCITITGSFDIPNPYGDGKAPIGRVEFKKTFTGEVETTTITPVDGVGKNPILPQP